MSFLARLVTDSSESLENWSWGTVLPGHPKTTFLHGVRVLVHGYLRVRFDLPIQRYKRFPQIGGP